MDGINRENAKQAIPLMEKAIKILEDPQFTDIEEAISRKAVHKIKLAGIYNALGNYQKALEIAQNTEDLINSSGFDNCDTFYAQGLIARERGISFLRMNQISKAYDYFKLADEILTKLMKGDYLFKIKVHEVECLIRLNRLDEAFSICRDILSIKNREITNYSNLLFNTCYYHAAIIKYRKKDPAASKKYFRDFFQSMSSFLKEILSKEEFDMLEQDQVFDTNVSMRKFFENSLKVFGIIYGIDNGFIKYYVEDNLKLLK